MSRTDQAAVRTSAAGRRAHADYTGGVYGSMLAASVVIEQNDEWLVGHRYLSSHSLEAILNDYKKDNSTEEVQELTAA